MAILRYLVLCSLTAFAFVGYSINKGASIYFDNAQLNKLDNEVRDGSYGKVTGLLILNGQGKVLHERYYGFSSRSSINQISSVTKSITSLMMGICLEKGFIKSIDIPIYTYFPEFSEIFKKDTLKKSITIRNLLNQTTGLKWEEWKYPYNYASNSLIALLETQTNWVQKFFELQIEAAPGIKFCYNSLASQVVAEIISRASGMPFEELTKQFLFKPLSINNYFWDKYPSNALPAWGGISMTSLDMAKIGLVVLNNGAVWGNQIVSEEWIKESTKDLVTFNDSIGYGLHWWISKQTDGNPLIYAAGYGDQFVYVAPDKGIVIAINSQNFSDYRWPKGVEELVSNILSSITYSKI